MTAIPCGSELAHYKPTSNSHLLDFARYSDLAICNLATFSNAYKGFRYALQHIAV